MSDTPKWIKWSEQEPPKDGKVRYARYVAKDGQYYGWGLFSWFANYTGQGAYLSMEMDDEPAARAYEGLEWLDMVIPW